MMPDDVNDVAGREHGLVHRQVDRTRDQHHQVRVADPGADWKDPTLKKPYPDSSNLALRKIMDTVKAPQNTLGVYFFNLSPPHGRKIIT